MEKIFTPSGKWYFYFLIFCLFAGAMPACKTETAPPLEMGYDYQPLEAGLWVIYDVDSVVYDNFTGLKHEYFYQVKELVESLEQQTGEYKDFRLHRFRRLKPTDPWQTSNIWQIRQTASRLERMEENRVIVKLVFPVRLNALWNGNAYNTLQPQTYRYTRVHEPYQVNGHVFDSTLTVLQNQLLTLISEDFQLEVYARDIGMIYKKYVKLSKEIDGTILGGVDYSFKVSSFGRNAQ